MKSFIKKSLLSLFGIQLGYKRNLWYLDPFIILKKLTLNSQPVIFDIGACDGHTSIIFKKLFPGSRIHAFEPYPDSFNKLANTADSIEGISAHQYALSESNGAMEFFVNKSKATNSLLLAKPTNSFIDDHIVYEQKIMVETMMLDNFVRDNDINEIDILKLDVQGGEMMVFKGSTEILMKKIPQLIYTEIWFIEGYKGQPFYHDIASYLGQFGYLPYGVYNMHYRKDGHFL